MIPANRFPHLSNLVPEFMGAEAFVADTVTVMGYVPAATAALLNRTVGPEVVNCAIVEKP